MSYSNEKPVRHIEPFTNEFGDVIQPGDAVYVITRCTGQTSVKKGEYLGVIKRTGWRGATELAVQVRVDAKKMAWRYTDTGENTTWTEYYYNGRKSDRKVEMYYVPYKRVSTLQLNRIVPGKVSAEKLAEAI